jgi:hypothetical protein
MKRSAILMTACLTALGTQASFASSLSCSTPNNTNIQVTYNFTVYNPLKKTMLLSIYGVKHNQNQPHCKNIQVPTGLHTFSAKCSTYCYYGQTVPFQITPNYQNYNSWVSLSNNQAVIIQPSGCLEDNYAYVNGNGKNCQ